MIYHSFMSRVGLFITCRVFVALYSLLITLASVLFIFQTEATLLAFLVLVAIRYIPFQQNRLQFQRNFSLITCSGIPLGGFQFGQIQIMEKGISTDRMKLKGAQIETALTSVATLAVYGLCIVFSDTSQFIILVWISCFWTLLGTLIFLLWSTRRTVQNILLLS
jgi:hypothetical protein